MLKEKIQKRIRRHKRVRAKVSGTAERPRLAVFRSNKHIYAQLIDDVNKKTLVSAGDIEKGMTVKGNKKEIAHTIGKALAEGAKSKKITHVVFDRGGFIFTGRIQALAEGAREGGLIF